MKALLPAISLAFMLLVAGCASPQAGGAKVCQICSGKLVRVGTIKDDMAKPSKNIDIWNRSMCAVDPPPDDAFCTRCWHTYSQNSERWTRSSEVLDSFHRPICTAIRNVPLPASDTVVFHQRLVEGVLKESVSFWCSTSPRVIRPLRAYARRHGLAIRVDEPRKAHPKRDFRQDRIKSAATRLFTAAARPRSHR